VDIPSTDTNLRAIVMLETETPFKVTAKISKP